MNFENTEYDHRIKRWRANGYFPSEIAWGMNIPLDFVYHRFKELNLPLHILGRQRKLQDPEILREAINNKSLTIGEIAQQFDTGYNTVEYYARKFGVVRKSPASNVDENVLREKYCEQCWPVSWISRTYGWHDGAIIRRLKKMGVFKTRHQQTCDRRSREKGCPYHLSSGYPLVRIPVGHNTRGKKLDGNWAFAHVIEMEKKLGRPLLKNERVHHVDCDKMNFNIENLLLCGNDPVHQRLHSTLESVVGKLYKAGIVDFTPEQGYFVKDEVKDEELETQDCAK